MAEKTKVDRRREDWESWKRHYFQRWGVQWDGEIPLTNAEKMDEVRYKKIERDLEKSRREWDGQDSTDETYEGIFNVKIWMRNQRQVG